MIAPARPSPNPLRDAVRWLAMHARFPASRLEPRAELMVCVSILAAAHEAAPPPGVRRFERRLGGQSSAQRIHALRRSQVHFKCDNSAKV